jgi:predicted dehydrogenase
MNNNGILRFGVIGAGRIGKIHAENLATRIPCVEVAAIADIDLKCCPGSRGPPAYPCGAGRLPRHPGDPTIDAVAICSSTDTHAQIIIEAAQAGKHIFCEKPIAHDLAKIDAASGGSAVGRCQAANRLSTGALTQLRPCAEMVAEGKIGIRRSCASPAATQLRRPSLISNCPAVCSWI